MIRCATCGACRYLPDGRCAMCGTVPVDVCEGCREQAVTTLALVAGEQFALCDPCAVLAPPQTLMAVSW